MSGYVFHPRPGSNPDLEKKVVSAVKRSAFRNERHWSLRRDLKKLMPHGLLKNPPCTFPERSAKINVSATSALAGDVSIYH